MKRNIEYCVCTDTNVNSTYKYIIDAFETACKNLMRSGIVNGIMQWKNYGLVEICILKNNAYQINIILNYDAANNLVHIDVSIDIINTENRNSVKFKPIELASTGVALSQLIESNLKEYIEEYNKM